jgi:fatty acid-binding protein DegV
LDGVVVLFDKKKALDKQVERITDYVKKSFDNFKSLTKVAVSDQYKEWVEAQQPKLAVSKAVA